MLKRINRFISHPVVSKVVGGLLLAGILWALTYVKGFYPTTWRLIRSVPSALATPLSLPFWIVVLLFVFAVIGLLSCKRKLFPRESLPAHVTNFRTADFFGIRWRWGYFHNRIPHKFHPFCKHCDTELILQERRPAYACLDPDVWLHCETCNSKVLDLDCSIDELVNRVKRQVEMQIRTDNWRT